MPELSRSTRRLIIVLGGLVTAGALVLGGTWFYINVLSDDAPDPFTLDASADEPGGPDDSEATDEPADESADDDTSGAGSDTQDTETSASLDGTWLVDERSEAGYRVDEVLNGLDNTVVGRTGDVSGEVVVDAETVTGAEIVVDMTTVTTDSDSRDGQFRGSIMNTEEFPTSTFRLTDDIPLAGLGEGGDPVSVTTRGEMTLRDVTREVEVELEMQLRDGVVNVAGAAPITFRDFEVEPPDLGFVRVEDDGSVEFLLFLTRG